MRRAVASLLALSACVAAEDAKPAPAATPAPTPAIVEQVPDVARLRSHLQQSPLGAIWALPELAPLKQRLDDRFGQIEAQTGLEPWALLNDLDTLRIEVTPQGPDAARPMSGRFALSFASQADALWKTLAQLGGGDPARPVTLGRFSLAHDSTWVYAADAGEPKAIEPLTGFPADADFCARTDLDAFIRALGIDGLDAATAVLGLKTIDYSATIGAEGARDVMAMPGAKLPLQPIDPAALAALPADAILVDAIGIDGEKLDAQLADAAKTLKPLAARIGVLEKGCQDLGVGDFHALLKGIKGTAALAVTSGTPFPSVTILLPGSAGLDKLLDTLAATASVPLDQARAQAVVLPLPGRLPITAQIRRTETQWVVSTDVMLLERIASPTPADGFDAKAKIELALDGAGEARALLWQDNAAVVRLAQMGVAMAAAGQRRGRGDNAQLMQDIAKALGAAAPKLAPTVGALVADASGATLRGRNLGMQSFILGVGAGVALPGIAQARASARRASSGNNERQLVLACLVWGNDHDAKWPVSLEALAKDMGKDLPAKLFTSPSAPEIAGAYLYVRPSPAVMSTQPVIVEDPACNRGRGSMVCFGDAHVEFLRGTKAWEEARRLSQLPKAKDAGIEAGDWAPLGQQGAPPPPPPAPVPIDGGKTEF